MVKRWEQSTQIQLGMIQLGIISIVHYKKRETLDMQASFLLHGQFINECERQYLLCSVQRTTKRQGWCILLSSPQKHTRESNEIALANPTNLRKSKTEQDVKYELQSKESHTK